MTNSTLGAILGGALALPVFGGLHYAITQDSSQLIDNTRSHLTRPIQGLDTNLGGVLSDIGKDVRNGNLVDNIGSRLDRSYVDITPSTYQDVQLTHEDNRVSREMVAHTWEHFNDHRSLYLGIGGLLLGVAGAAGASRKLSQV